MEQLWSACHPKTDEEMIECATLGKSLSKLSQPTILTILAANNKPMLKITISDGDFTKLLQGKLDPGKAYDEGRLKAEGDLGKALLFSDLLQNKVGK